MCDVGLPRDPVIAVSPAQRPLAIASTKGLSVQVIRADDDGVYFGGSLPVRAEIPTTEGAESSKSRTANNQTTSWFDNPASATSDATRIVRESLDGSQIVTFANAQFATMLAQDSRNVYWTDSTAEAIFALAK